MLGTHRWVPYPHGGASPDVSETCWYGAGPVVAKVVSGSDSAVGSLIFGTSHLALKSTWQLWVIAVYSGDRHLFLRDLS